MRDISTDEFYADYLSRVVQAMEATGGAIWTLAGQHQLDLAWKLNLDETGLTRTSDEEQAQHAKLLKRVVTGGQGILIKPHGSAGDDGDAGNPTDMLLFIAPLRCGGQIQGVVEIFRRSDNPPRLERDRLVYLLETCELAGDFLVNARLRSMNEREAMWTQLKEFSRAVHSKLDPLDTAYTIANDGRRLIGCDRATVAVRRGRRFAIEAVSGQDTLERRSNMVVALEKLATAVAAGGEAIWYSGDATHLAPQIEAAIHQYIDESHAKSVAVLPLVREAPNGQTQSAGPAVGVLIVEQLSDGGLDAAMRHRIETVREEGGSALANAVDYHSGLLMPIARVVSRTGLLLHARALPKTVLVVAVLLATAAALAFIPADFHLEGRGTLLPAERREIFAGTDGVVHEVLVHHGQQVRKGDVLLRLRNTDLDVALAEVLGQLVTVEQRILGLSQDLFTARNRGGDEQARIQGELIELKETQRSLTEQLKLYRRKQENLTVASPLDGIVVTWQVDEKLQQRPVQKGQVLLTVAAPEGPWELEIQMAEDRIGHLDEAGRETGGPLPVQYILASNPGTVLHGKTKEVHDIAEVKGEEGTVVLVRAAIDKADLIEPRPGTTVTAKVYCGRRSVGYVWFHDLIAFVQSRILFHFY
jgi:hypothetical protein